MLGWGSVIMMLRTLGVPIRCIVFAIWLCHNDVADIILKLEIDNYSETQECTIYKGEKIWIFGYDYHSYELYIKLRLRKKVICISFHEKEYEINYPYCGGGK